LSCADLKEYKVILQRAGFERLSHEQVKKLRVCPCHRYGLGKYWRPSKLCQYPGHNGTPTSVKSQDMINPAIAKEVFQLFGISVPKYKTQHLEDFLVIKCFSFYNASFIGYFLFLFFYLFISHMFTLLEKT